MLGHLQLSVLLVALIFSAQVLESAAQVDANKKITTTTSTTTTTPAAPPTTFPPPTPGPETTTSAPTNATTTTTAPPITTVAPTPAPKKFPANEGKWSVVDAQNVTCILFKGAMELTIAYQDKDSQNRSANVDIPVSAVASGNCGSEQTLTLTWPASETGVNQVTFAFESNSTTGVLQAGSGISSLKYGLQNITGSVVKDAALFINVTDLDTPVKFEMLNKAAFQTPLNHSYSCLAQETLKSEDDKVTMKFSDIRMEAFRLTPAGHQQFSASIDCPADDASDLVPIAVGAALASLVVIVLIAYLIGRRRSRARGYQSV